MQTASESFDSMHAQVRWLRSQEYRIRTEDELMRVKTILEKAQNIKVGSGNISSHSLMCYARTLRGLLSCHELPEKFTLTNSIQVPSYEKGDEVDGQFIINVKVGGKMTTTREWSAGLVINTRARNQTQPYQVFWIGHPPKKSGSHRNPMWMSPHVLRQHAEGAVVGNDGEWKSIEGIWNWTKSTLPEVTDTHGGKDGEIDVVDGDVEANGVNPIVEVHENSVEMLPEQRRNSRSTSKVTEISASSGNKRTPPEAQAKEKVKKKKCKKVKKKKGENRMLNDEDHEATCESGGAGIKPSPCKTGFFTEMFSTEDDVQYAISALLSSEEPTIKTLQNLKEGLLRIANGLSAVYRTSSYFDMVNQTLEELDSYAGAEKPQLPHSKEFLRRLRDFGFCVSPRMFSVSEILCIATALLDAKHRFMIIKQKTTGLNSKSGFRGMAMLDSRVQQFFYRRLQEYGFADPLFHPPDLQTFSSVVINGGGSFLQAADWDYEHESRFQMDAAVTPFAIEVSDSPGLFECNGLYVASTLRMNEKAVYVQVSKVELGLGLKKCLKPEFVSKWEQAALDSMGSRQEVCSPRVLVFTGTTWAIKLLPAIATTMCLLKFHWDAHSDINSRESLCLKCASFDGKFEMQWCTLKLRKFCTDSACLQDISVTHKFSFGCKKYVYNEAQKWMPDGHAPGPLWPQAIHADGPRLYDTRVYDVFGNFKTTASSCAKLQVPQSKHKGDGIGAEVNNVEKEYNSWCPFMPSMLQLYFEDQNDILTESWSALGGVFSGTYVETLKGSQDRRARNTEDAALRVHIPLGCMVLFSFHWLHRGKGDKVTSLDPAPVHARPHFYLYSRDMRKMPNFDVESSLEFIGICTDKASADDPASKQHALETLQTFTPNSAYGHSDMECLPPVHQYFESQTDLDAWIQEAHAHQSVQKNEAAKRDFVNVSNWYLKLSYEVGQQKLVRLLGSVTSGEVEVVVKEANFSAPCPEFYGDDGKAYRLDGFHKEGLDMKSVANTFDVVSFPELFCSESFKKMLDSAFSTLLDQWCPASLVNLMSLLDTRVLKDAKLLRGRFDVLHAKTATETIPLLPSFDDLGLNDIRLYTSRLDFRRTLVHILSVEDQHHSAKRSRSESFGTGDAVRSKRAK